MDRINVWWCRENDFPIADESGHDIPLDNPSGMVFESWTQLLKPRLVERVGFLQTLRYFKGLLTS